MRSGDETCPRLSAFVSHQPPRDRGVDAYRAGTGISRCGEAIGGLAGNDALTRLLLEAHHTTHIEGTRLTLEQAARLLAGQAVPEADPEDVRELLNYRDAFEFVSGYLNEGGPITEGLIREIHRRLVAGVRGGSAAARRVPARAELRREL